MADIEQRFTARQDGVEVCADCGAPQLTAIPYSSDEVLVTLYDWEGNAKQGVFTSKQLHEFAEAAGAVLVKTSEVYRARQS